MRPSSDTPLAALVLSGLLGLLVVMAAGPVVGVTAAVVLAIVAPRSPVPPAPVPLRLPTRASARR